MVVVHHVLDQSTSFYSLLPTESFQAGVDIFFVISGFVMVYVTTFRERSAGRFLAMRAARIVPVYWFYTLCAVILMALLPKLFRSNELTFEHVVSSLLFIPHRTEATGWGPVIKQGWTLNYEVFFYLLFAIAISISINKRVGISAAALASLSAFGFVMHNHESIIGFYSDNIILEFMFGMMIAVLYINGSIDRVGRTAGVVLLAGGACLLFVSKSDYRVLDYGVPALFIVTGALVLERRIGVRNIRILHFFGDSSYSIYLVHVFVIAVLRAVWPVELAGIVNLLLFLGVTMALVAACSAVSYLLVERTSLRYLRSKIDRTPL